MSEHLSPTEAARRLGVTVKALKVYERRGLVSPHRLANGWRVYGPDQVVRIHEVLALKAMGLSLAKIAALLADKGADLARTLDLQEAVLRERRAAADRTLALIARVRRRLTAGETLSPAEVLALPREAPASAETWGLALNRHYEKHLGAAARIPARGPDAAHWDALIAELKALNAAGADPRAAASLDFMGRWIAASDEASGGDRQLEAGAYAAWMDALDDPETAPLLPLGKAEIDYLGRLGAAWAQSASGR